MSSTFAGFSEEDLKRIKSNETGQTNGKFYKFSFNEYY